MALLRRHGIALAAVLLGTLAFAAVMTEGKLDLTTRGTHYTDFYDQLGRSMLHGRFDVPPESVGLEAFVIDGKSYGYWGPTPALLRLPLDALFPSMWGRWTQLIMLGSAAASLLAVHVLFDEIGALVGGWTARRAREQLVAAAFVLTTALGSTLFFIGRRPTIYHEAIVVGCAFAMWSFALLVRYLGNGRARDLVLAVLAGVLADLARGSVGAGALLSLGLLAGGMIAAIFLERAHGALAYLGVPRGPQLRRHALLLVGLLAVSGAVIAYRNVKTVGNLSGAPRLDQHIAVSKDPARMARTQGRLLHVENMRTMAYNYFRLDGIVAHPPFPWFSPRDGRTAHVFPEAHYDNAEPYVSVPSAYTFWFVLSLAGLAVALRRRAPAGATHDDHRERLRLVLVGAAFCSLGAFLHIYITLRYLHDLFPLLVIAAALGLQQLLALQSQRRWARALLPLVVLLALYTCLTSVAITLATARWT